MVARRIGLLPGLLGAMLLAGVTGGRGVADEAPGVFAEGTGLQLGDLSRLAQLERQYGNGGAETEHSAVVAGYDKKEGFFLRDQTGDFLLQLKAQLQIRYSYFARDQRGSVEDAGEVGAEDDSALELERARFVIQGNVLSKNLKYKFQADGDSDNSGGWRSLDAFVEYWAGEDLTGDAASAGLLGIGVGQFKPFFLRQESASSSKLQMVERNIANEFFNIDRNLGLWVRGDIGDVKSDAPSVYYALAVTNGFDSANVRPALVDSVPAFVAKLDFQLWGDKVERGEYEEGNPKHKDLFTVGLSAATDQNNNSSGVGGPRVKIYTFGFDTQLKVDAFSFQAEYMGRWVDYQKGNAAVGGRGDTQYAHGAYAQTGFMITDALEVAGRAAFIWGDGVQKGNGVEIGPGLNWYISGDHKIKLQTDVAWFDLSPNLPDSTEDLDGTLGTTGNGNAASSFESSAANVGAGEQGVLWRTQLQLSF